MVLTVAVQTQIPLWCGCMYQVSVNGQQESASLFSCLRFWRAPLRAFSAVLCGLHLRDRLLTGDGCAAAGWAGAWKNCSSHVLEKKRPFAVSIAMSYVHYTVPRNVLGAVHYTVPRNVPGAVLPSINRLEYWTCISFCYCRVTEDTFLLVHRKV